MITPSPGPTGCRRGRLKAKKNPPRTYSHGGNEQKRDSGQEIALRHIPFGYSPPRNKEAHVMMLPTTVVQWCFFVPFGKRGRLLNTLPVNHPQCPFIQMTDTDVTDVTFMSCYNIVGHTRMHVMTLTSPPSLPLSRPWAGLSMRRLSRTS